MKNSQDTINSILRKRLEHCIPRWSVECGKRLDRWDPDVDDDESLEFTFPEFLAFLKRQNRISVYKSSIKGATSSDDKSGGKENRGKNERTAKIAAASASSAPNQSGSAPPPRKGKWNNKIGAGNATSAPKRTQTPATDAGWSCPCCGSDKYHTLNKCHTFIAKSHEEKFSVIKANGICLSCLEKGHMSRNCTKEVSCGKCDKKHHPLMHREDGDQPDATI